MFKAGLIYIDYNRLLERIDLKNLYLMFHKLCIVSPINRILGSDSEEIQISVERLKEDISNNIGDTQIALKNIEDISFLHEQGFIEYPYPFFILPASTLPDQKVSDMEIIEDIPKENMIDFLRDCKLVDIKEDPGLFLRLLVHQKKDKEDLYPLLNIFPKELDTHKKSEVLKFILSNFPQPNKDMSWDQLKDFKSDPDTMRKYYALTKWVNDVSKKDLQLHEIEDEYNYLYHEYSNQFRIHKLKYQHGFLEIITTAAIDIISGQLGVTGISTSIFNIWKQNINLLEAETKFTGREVAYIYKAKETFKQ
jgi:hypothetical protein